MAKLELEVITEEIKFVKSRFSKKLHELKAELTIQDVQNNLNYKFIFEYIHDPELDKIWPYLQEKAILGEIHILQHEGKIKQYQILSNPRIN